eukprot:782995-Prymnesium_polylepis.2
MAVCLQRPAGCSWNASRCTCTRNDHSRGPSSACALTVAITEHPRAVDLESHGREPIWHPPDDGSWRVVNSSREACVHIIVKSLGTKWNQQSYRSHGVPVPISSGYPFLNKQSGGGRNTVFVDFSDWRFRWNCSLFAERRRVFGCAALALTHSRPEHYTPTLGDISLPAGLHLGRSTRVP